MNALMVIAPYRHENTWVFDDERAGLVKEPFVLGVDTMIDRITSAIPDAANGFRLIFSAMPFPNYAVKLDWRREEFGGNWYFAADYDLEGWLCPALFKYFDDAPREIYVRAEAK